MLVGSVSYTILRREKASPYIQKRVYIFFFEYSQFSFYVSLPSKTSTELEAKISDIISFWNIDSI